MRPFDSDHVQRQLDELRSEVAAARTDARLAVTQANIARWCSTQLAHVFLDMLIKGDAVGVGQARLHLSKTLALMKPHRKQAGMRELAKELEFLLGKLSGEPQAGTTEPCPAQVN